MTTRTALTLSQFKGDLPYLYQEVIRKKDSIDPDGQALMTRIFSYLSQEEVCKVSQVSHIMRSSCCNEIIKRKYSSVVTFNLSHPIALHTPSTPEAVQFLKKIPVLFSTILLNIRELDLRWYPLAQGDLSKIVAKTSRLEVLILSNTVVTDADLGSLSHIYTLTYVNLEFCPRVTTTGIQALKRLPSLKKVQVSSFQNPPRPITSGRKLSTWEEYLLERDGKIQASSSSSQKLPPQPIAPTRPFSAWEEYLIREKEGKVKPPSAQPFSHAENFSLLPKPWGQKEPPSLGRSLNEEIKKQKLSQTVPSMTILELLSELNRKK